MVWQRFALRPVPVTDRQRPVFGGSLGDLFGFTGFQLLEPQFELLDVPGQPLRGCMPPCGCKPPVAPTDCAPSFEPSFSQQFLGLAVAQGEAEVEPDRVLDDLGREAM